MTGHDDVVDRVVVTGANGQDGSYLVHRLAAEGHEVHGFCRTASGAELLVRDVPQATAHVCDLGDADAIDELIARIRPTHVFNLAGNTSVARSWDYPAEAADVLGVGPVRLLQAAWRLADSGAPVRFVQASSAEIFGDATDVPQTESTLRAPVTPYGAAKNFAQEMVGVYRKRGMFASAAILYNHESPRRPESFVARKISRGVAQISRGHLDRLVLGNIDVHRDWGYAPDYVDALLRIARAEEPGDFIVATGVSHTVRDFVDRAFRYVGIDDWSRFVVIDPGLYRPADPKTLVGDSGRLRGIGWEPSVSFEDLVRLMVEADLKALPAD